MYTVGGRKVYVHFYGVPVCDLIMYMTRTALERTREALGAVNPSISIKLV